MSFKTDHPDYKSYDNATYHVAEVPAGFKSALQGFILGQCKETHHLKAALNDIAGRIPTEPTTNWGRDYLINDLSYYVRQLCDKPLPKLMDFLADACSAGGLDFSAEDVNEFLEEHHIGYVLETTPWGTSSTWLLRGDVTSRVETVDDTAAEVKDVCTQTYEHILQARKHLANTTTDRDRKDAIRDCLSAMETMLKTLSGKADIKDATTHLRQEKSWGPDIIVKDGLTLWGRMHDLYPDVRHGNPKKVSVQPRHLHP